jgi:hypothetical protein
MFGAVSRVIRNVRQIEETAIRAVLAHNNGNRKATARAIGFSYRMLLYKLRDMDIPSVRRSRSFMNVNLGAADADLSAITRRKPTVA